MPDNQTTDHKVEHYTPNIEDRAPRDFLNDTKIQDLAKNVTSREITFHAANIDFFVACVQKFTLEIAEDQDADNIRAFQHGYKTLNTFAAISKVGEKVYGLYEFYSFDNGKDEYLTKAIEVDCNFQRKGIGKAFLTVIRNNGIKAEPSGNYTKAGAALLNSLS